MDPNSLLCWLVGIGSIGNTIALFVMYRFRAPSWYFVYGLNAALLTACLVFFPDSAGYLMAPFFALTVLAPTWLIRGANLAAVKNAHGVAYRMVQAAGVLHPFGLHAAQARIMEATWRIDRGEIERARDVLRALAKDRESPAAEFAAVHLHRLDGDYAAMRAFLESDVSRRLNPGLAPIYMRAICETGSAREITDLLAEWQRRPLHGEYSALVRLAAAAALGRVAFVDALLDGPLAIYVPEVKTYWRATAMLAAERGEEGRALLSTLATTASHAMRIAAKHRLEHPPPEHALADEQRAWLAKLEAEAIHEASALQSERGLRRFVTATTGLILANLAMFIAEIPGDLQSDVNLLRLGALLIPIPAWTDAWRLVTACFLHYGWLHLIMNMVSLSLFGPVVERALGFRRFLVLYFATGVTSMAAYSLLGVVLAMKNVVVVGASGSIMGLIGALLGVTLGEWLQTRSRALRQRMFLIAIIFGAQTLFDLFTPNIAMFVHDAGAVIGVILGVALRRK